MSCVNAIGLRLRAGSSRAIAGCPWAMRTGQTGQCTNCRMGRSSWYVFWPSQSAHRAVLLLDETSIQPRLADPRDLMTRLGMLPQMLIMASHDLELLADF